MYAAVLTRRQDGEKNTVQTAVSNGNIIVKTNAILKYSHTICIPIIILPKVDIMLFQKPHICQ